MRTIRYTLSRYKNEYVHMLTGAEYDKVRLEVKVMYSSATVLLGRCPMSSDGQGVGVAVGSVEKD